MQKDFITATPDSGGSGSTTVTAAASANQTESARSVSLSVAGGGMTRTVGASQAARVVTWNYYFSVTPTSLSFVAGGGSKSVTVTSYRKKVINGVETSTQENVTYTVAVTGTGFSGSGTTVTAASNSSTSKRTGTATYTQTTSGKSQGVSLSQAAGKTPNRIRIVYNYANKTAVAKAQFNVTSLLHIKGIINSVNESTGEPLNEPYSTNISAGSNTSGTIYMLTGNDGVSIDSVSPLEDSTYVYTF